MKKDQNLPNKTVYSNNSSGKTLPNNTNYTRNNHHITQVIEEDHQNEETRKIHHKITTNRPNSRNNYSRSNSNTQRFVSRS